MSNAKKRLGVAVPFAKLRQGFQKAVDLAIVEPEAAIIQLAFNTCFLEQRASALGQADELAMRHGIGDEIAGGRQVG